MVDLFTTSPPFQIYFFLTHGRNQEMIKISAFIRKEIGTKRTKLEGGIFTVLLHTLFYLR
jgi:hypothetical protein